MPRTKQPHTGTVSGLASLVWTAPAHEGTESAAPHSNVPAIDCQGPDGRRWFITFEPLTKPISRDDYIRRMRRVAATIQAEAARMEADPSR